VAPCSPVTPPQPTPGVGMMRHSTTRLAIGQSSGRKGPRGRDPFAGPAERFRHPPGPDYNAPARANVTTRARGGMASPLPGGALQMVRAGGRRRALAPRCPVPPFHEPMLVRRPALRRHRHFPAAKAGTTKAPLLVMKCAAGIVASPQGRGNRRSVGTPWKASFHRTR